MCEFDQETFSNLCQALSEKNEDGINQFAPMVFKDLDKNSDGQLDEAELKAFAGAISSDAEKTYAEMMADLDYNHDG